MYYINLPEYVKNFTKVIPHKDLLKHVNGHDWCQILTKEFLTDDGIDWFLTKGIKLKSTALLFKIPGNFEGPIHSENHAKNNFAFNFVIEGKGQMQWIENIQATTKPSTANNTNYTVYTDINSFEIADVWEGDIGLVRIDIPHRVVSYLERYCVSIRTVYDSAPKIFDDAVHMIYNETFGV